MTTTQLETSQAAAQLEIPQPEAPLAPAQLEMHSATAQLGSSSAPAQLEAPPARRVVEDSRYVLSGLPLAVASFVVCGTAFTAGLSLAVVWIGVPLLMLALLQSRKFATQERARAGAVLGVEVPEPAYRGGRLLPLITDRMTWWELSHAMLRFIPNTIAVSFVATWWAGMLGGVSFALWGWSLPGDDLPELLGLSDTYAASVICYLVTGLIFALTLPAVVRAAARFEARIALTFLGR
ncbi:sensor domain-containing protein [Actinoplanes sp. TRM 88003]|uniref:Sensor domain-containing protein n=1 Tax=Paractinoplanes aksuensis TaxID=2939490 RepID=A0ABT1DRZ2_9ACTN|nr:sensor domain-containing protein [Actinoplanes aksuensis]MCO8273283.1 sensor domain-containing protein [Actinoplanes aksuensis]